MKQIKDPIYGYIEVDDIYIQLVNTPEFQRLSFEVMKYILRNWGSC